ncbi:ureidoglycolate lyase [Gymnodinialimonas ceratoperidinii]|uniref:Ureidoglycolate lyase n=1 Tax=Gymnodinialimonas ceratoperidinii TaxID=2856823 RepID=A0A8F6TZA9_9RHOB|nr:ureidoglycolate lyase [Gymnodinialimonas ceratoperidinii]QXT41218.1 ureidoglycolate lyase [Gymnodinialimonas ceratoperidinii]
MTLVARPITAEAFAPFGQVIALTDAPITINEGMCQRFNDLAEIDIIEGRPGLSLFQSKLRQLPYSCDLLERHPLGSQCFIPMSDAELLVIVAPDAGGKPGAAQAFTARNDVAVNIARNTWHGVLSPLSGSGMFAVIDRIGTGDNPGQNLEEHRLEEPLQIIRDS